MREVFGPSRRTTLMHTQPVSTPRPFNWPRFAFYLVTVLAVSAGIGLGVLFALGHKPIEARTAARVNHADVRVQFEWPPLAARPARAAARGAEPAVTGVADRPAPSPAPGTWLPDQFQNDLKELVRQRLASWPDPFSGAALGDVGSALKASGWFEDTPALIRDAGNTLSIRGRWRVPAAFVRWDGRDYLIAWDGKLLPPVYQPGQVNLRAIVAVEQGPPRSADGKLDFHTAWPGAGLSSAVELLALLSQRPWYAQVRGVDLADYPASRRLTLLTVYGTRVVWGGRPGRPLPGESATAAKLAKLDLLHRDFKRIDTGRPAIDISLQAPPLEIDISATAGRAASAPEGAPAQPAGEPAAPR